MFHFVASMSSFLMAYTESDFFGKGIMLGLVALSIISWVVLLTKISLFRKARNASLAFQEQCLQKEGELLIWSREGEAYGGPFEEIFSVLQEKGREILRKNHKVQAMQGKGPPYLVDSDIELLENYGLTALSTQSKVLEKNLFVLSTVVTLAPFLGLLGTVWGILVTFSGLQGGASAGSNAAILGGLSTALVTTVMGLLIAIPALIAYNYLRSSLTRFDSEMDDFVSQVISALEMQYRKSG